MVAKELEMYLTQLRGDRGDLCFPNFCEKYAKKIDDKKILAILQDPGVSDVENTKQCSICNQDETAENQRASMNEVGIDYSSVLFWNFYPFFGYEEKKKNEKITPEFKKYWTCKIHDLIKLLPNVEVVIIFGNVAWDGIQFFCFNDHLPIIRSPHPGAQSYNQSGTPERIESAWACAKSILEEKNK